MHSKALKDTRRFMTRMFVDYYTLPQLLDQIQDIDVWVRINGTDVVGSTGRVSIPNRHGSIDGHVLPAWNYYLPLNANDYVQLYWAATSTAVSLETMPASSPHPSTASLIATIQKVG